VLWKIRLGNSCRRNSPREPADAVLEDIVSGGVLSFMKLVTAFMPDGRCSPKGKRKER
jgi:hypothetical protein